MGHAVELPASVIDRVLKRRGRVHVFADLDPRKTALVVIDMQKAFVASGAPLEVPMAWQIVANINSLARAMRAAGGHVFWVKTTLAATGRNAWPVYHGNFFSPERAASHLAALSEGASHHALDPSLDVVPTDAIVEKNRFSAMMPAACDLPERLAARQIDTLVITGTLSNFCCETTARDAMMLGFRIFFVSDANAALTDEEHLAALVSIVQAFGDVRATERMLELIAASKR